MNAQTGENGLHLGKGETKLDGYTKARRARDADLLVRILSERRRAVNVQRERYNTTSKVNT